MRRALALAAGLLVLAGCGGGSSTTPVASTTPAQGGADVAYACKNAVALADKAIGLRKEWALKVFDEMDAVRDGNPVKGLEANELQSMKRTELELAEDRYATAAAECRAALGGPTS